MSCWARVLPALFVAALGICAPRVLYAQGAVAIDAQQELRSHFLARGASDVRLVSSGFALEREGLVFADRIGAPGCVAYLGIGTSGISDVDLTVTMGAGLVVSEDRSRAPSAYARVCVEPGARLLVAATAFGGRGHISLYRIEGAPEGPFALPARVAPAAGVDAPSLLPREVGPMTVEHTLEVTALQSERAHAAQGFIAKGAPRVAEVRAGFAEAALLMRKGQCGRVMVFVPRARGLRVDVVGGGQTFESATSASEVLTTPVCPSEGGLYNVRVRSRTARSVALIRFFEHTLASPADALRYGCDRAVANAVVAHDASQHGLALRESTETWIEPQLPLSVPIHFDKPGCYAVYVVLGEGMESQLRLIDEVGAVVADDEGRREFPVVYVCTNRARRYQAVLLGRGASGAASLWLASDVDGGPSGVDR